MTGLSQPPPTARRPYADYTWTYDADSEVQSFINAANVGGADCYAAESIFGLQLRQPGQLDRRHAGDGLQGPNSLANAYDANGNATNIDGARRRPPERRRQHRFPTGLTATSTMPTATCSLAGCRRLPRRLAQSGDTTSRLYGWDNRGRLTSVTYYTP